MSEILIICAVALLVFGPQQLPEMAKKIAKGLKEVRKASDDLKRSINLDDDDDRPRWKPPTPRPPLMEAAQQHLEEDPPMIHGSTLANGLVDDAQAPAADDDVPHVQVASPVSIDSSLEEPEPETAATTTGTVDTKEA
ncbi:MAG: twin-arginine translocase TatA/TatE family subunit [Deltaproteobacteria bacterium]|nr:twin-arginine translocase TatA/TatE family subunit [Deltaproteobacteria bacterium]